MVIEFLLLQAERGDQSALKMAVHTLKAMQHGGMYDVVGGGFHRYSTDSKWLIPHFEKMLYDNALLARVYLHAYLVTGDKTFRRTAEQTMDFVLREMTHPLGGFFSSLDADSENEEGKFYLWNPEELQIIFKDPKTWEFLTEVYSISSQGNFEGRIVLQQKAPLPELIEKLNLSESQFFSALDEIHRTLFQARSLRIRPLTDDKILTAWNALMLQTFAEAARYLGRADYLAAARKNADFLLTRLFQDDGLLRSWRASQAHLTAYLEDYAALIIALLELFQSDPDSRWFQAAKVLFNQMSSDYQDPQGGYFDTSINEAWLLVRPKTLQDNATPSGNSLATYATLLLASYDSNEHLQQQAEHILNSVSYPAFRYPMAFAEWLKSVDYVLGPQSQLAILVPLGASAASFFQPLWSRFRPRLVVGICAYPPLQADPEFLKNRPIINQSTTAYVCSGNTCLAPTTESQEFIRQLGE